MKYPDYCYFRNGKLRSPVALELAKLLETFSTDPDYILGTLNDLKSDEENQMVIDYIKNGDDVSYENIILLSLSISKSRLR